MSTKDFSREKLISTIPKLKSLSRKEPRHYGEEIRKMCAECGIAVVYVPHFKNTYVQGATRWLSPDKVLIQLSLRNKWEDILILVSQLIKKLPTLVQAFDISGTQECQIMHDLIKNVKGEIITLDAGFNDRNLVSEISKLGMKPFIFPKKNNNVNGDVYWQKMYLDFYYNTLDWLKNYHQRSHTESFHSSFKRAFGIITKLKFCSKFTQVCARIIIHNFRRMDYFNRQG